MIRLVKVEAKIQKSQTNKQILTLIFILNKTLIFIAFL